jgi:two-component system OmpR family response regulator
MEKSPVRVLVIDDDPDVRSATCRMLEAEGITSHAAEHAAAARGLLTGTQPASYDLMLLDVRMPGQSGWDFLSELRAGGDQTPVIFLTGVDTAGERARGLRLGADDYLGKPFDRAELLARIEAVRRRHMAVPVLSVDHLSIDLARREVLLDGRPVELSPQELDLLRALALADGRVLSRTELLEDVWGMAFDPGTTIVAVTVGRLRRKLGDLGRSLIETVKGEGYRLVVHAGEADAGR